jgi:C4-type Zn-finger protein
MTLLEGLLRQVRKNLRGVQVFHKEDMLKAIKEHNLFFANEIKIDNDEQGEHLILTFDDQIICFELTWRQDGPRLTLIDIRLA